MTGARLTKREGRNNNNKGEKKKGTGKRFEIIVKVPSHDPAAGLWVPATASRHYCVYGGTVFFLGGDWLILYLLFPNPGER